MVTRRLFLGFLGLLAIQRSIELRISKKNEEWMFENGGIEHASGHFRVMKLVHFTWFIAMACEVIFLKRLFIPRLSGTALLFTALGQGLRYSAIRSLDRRWSVRIITLPGSKPVTTGIYKYIRHPNYLGVTLEIFGVPLLHSAYITSLIWSFANLVILGIRIPREERALDEAA